MNNLMDLIDIIGTKKCILKHPRATTTILSTDNMRYDNISYESYTIALSTSSVALSCSSTPESYATGKPMSIREGRFSL